MILGQQNIVFFAPYITCNFFGLVYTVPHTDMLNINQFFKREV